MIVYFFVIFKLDFLNKLFEDGEGLSGELFSMFWLGVGVFFVWSVELKGE